MSFENFITQHGYNTKANDFASNYSVKSNDNDFATSKNRVSTLKTSQSSLDSTRENQKDFAEFMSSAKERHNTKQDKSAEKKTARTDKDQQTQDAPKAAKDDATLNEAKTAASAFYSKEAAMSFALSEEKSSTDGAKTLDEFNNGLQLLSNELQALIDSQSEQSEITELAAQIEGIREESFTISEEGHIQTQEGEVPEEGSLLQLLSSLIAEINAQEDGAETSGASTDVIQKIADIVKQDSGADLTTILSGLKPEEITDLKDQVNAYLTGDLPPEEQEELVSLITQYYPLAKPQRTDDNAREVSKTAEAVSNDILKTDIKAAKNTDSNKLDNNTEDRYNARFGDGKYDKSANQSRDRSSDNGRFNAELKNLSGQQMQTVEAPASNKADMALSASQRFLQAKASDMLPPALTDIEGISSQNNANNLAVIQAQNTVTNSLANVTTQAQSATQNHPATQMVSMTIQKAIKEGDDTNIKLRLDPPDLGRVEVKMSIDKDNTTKIVLTAEKPETHLLLQQDSEALQRAMSEAGLDTESGLSFELAGDDHEFNQDNGSNTKGYGSSSKGSDSEDEAVMQTTMDWHVDPDTGRMHYNILAQVLARGYPEERMLKKWQVM